ncbi:hypothetical protein XGA_4668, partial [Xanthomonas hortorum ATCC 19865]
ASAGARGSVGFHRCAALASARQAKQLGDACVGGQAMQRQRNGREQVSAAAGGWQRCQHG